MAIIERAREDLQLIESPREGARFIERAEAITYLAQKSRAGREVQNQAAELTLRAKRRAGQLLAEMDLHGGDRRSVSSRNDYDLKEILGTPSVDQAHNWSVQWQLIASAPEDKFELYLAETQTDGGELTTAGVVAIAKRLAAQAARKSERDARLIEPIDDYAEGPGWRLFGGDFRSRLAILPDGCIDAIMTDPPYNAESLPLWGDLAKHAARLLKPQGLLVALTGQILLPQVIEQVTQHLSYGWQYVQPLPGQHGRIMGRHVFQTWKPWIVFSNGPWPSGAIDWHEDTTPPSVMQKSYRWQQDGAPAAYLIEALTEVGDVVCDPFAGTGSYGEAVVGLGREFIGCEADAGRFAKAVERLRSQDA